MKNLFITGGAGYLGRALLRKLAKEAPETSCTIFSRDHGKHAPCRKEFPQHRYIIGDVCDYDTLELAMVGHDIVVHTAAFKYVPQGETNVAQCHEVNVMGSLNVARAAIRNGVARVVGISTDKACQPINVYGITKLMMERLFQEADRMGETQFNLVRYGNVVSSTGSAIPIFRQQARETGRIQITNPEMTRFWLSVYEGVNLIRLALTEPMGGTVLIPRLPSLSMADVARAAVAMEFESSLADNDDIEYETVGQRFGEKVHEDLLGEIEAIYAESLGRSIMRLYPMTSSPRNQGIERYNSEHPDYSLDIESAIKMIKEAPG